MIAARLAGGNLFLPFLGGGAFGSSSEHSDFFEGDFVVGDFWEHSEHSEQLGALGFFGDGGFFAIAFLEHSEQLGALGL